MIFVKSVLTGLVAAVLALLAWVVASALFTVIRLHVEVARVRETGRGGGVFVASGSIPGTIGLIVLAGAFVPGFYWMWRRSKRTRRMAR